MRKILLALATGALAFSAARRFKDSQENRRTWEASTDSVD